MSDSRAKILIIDDDVAILNLYKDALSAHYHVTTATDWLEGTDVLATKPFDLLILDLRMSVFDPVEFINRIRADGATFPILVSSAYTNLRERVAGLEIDAILAKPFSIADLERTVSELIEQSRTRHGK